ncbi:MAG: 23S rRNA (adenine(2503)-C(2))-methyltransferase RlmN [Chloroflexota bacterium]
MANDNLDVLNLTLPELEAAFVAAGHASFRARQVYAWTYKSYTHDFSAMSNLPKGLRASLADRALPWPVEPLVVNDADDGLTTKALLRLRDGHTVETVLMRQPGDTVPDERRSVCVSTQVGCPVGCVFCATGQSGFVRSLTAGEIVAQVLFFAARLAAEGIARPITNVVLMGQGEPLLNLANVKRTIETLNDPAGFNLGARHVTISTVGVVPGIHDLARWPLQVGLAISLHAPDDTLRSRLVPLNQRYPVRDVLAACRNYAEVTGRRVTYEYALISGVNDRPDQAIALAELLRGQLCHVNLIPLNATPGSPFQPPTRSRVLAFQAAVKARGIACTVRVERGAEIAAACGQLRRRYTDGTPRGNGLA